MLNKRDQVKNNVVFEVHSQIQAKVWNEISFQREDQIWHKTHTVIKDNTKFNVRDVIKWHVWLKLG
ncbi:MAG: hypothetical protein HKO92_07030 [Flavobacteriaceae bacterium]|nr:hypothetical protein [Flavobacteriaceae bacterium]